MGPFKSYRVTYRVEGTGSSTNATAVVMLHSASESEAIAALKHRGTIGTSKTVIILDIEEM